MKKIIISLFVLSFITLSFYKITFAETKKVKLSETGFLSSSLDDIKKDYENQSDKLIKVISPNSSKTYKTGDKISVKWKDYSDGDYNILIALMSEEDILPYDIAENELNDGDYQLTVNDELPSGKYFILLGDIKSDSRFAISKSFTIKNKTKELKNKTKEYLDKGYDAAAKANLSIARTQAELFYDINGNYSNVCKKDSDKDSGIRNYVKEAGKSSGGKTDCDSSVNAWSAEVKLKSNAYYCVDSTGYVGEQKKSKGSKAVACDGTKAQVKDKSNKSLKDTASKEDHFLSGNMNSEVKIITYSDFECPFCANFDKILRKISKEYGDKVGIVFRHFPLIQIHKNAEFVANASECVANIGGESSFSSYVEEVFLNTQDLSSDNLSTIAQNIGIDKKQFNSCLSNKKYSSKVKRDIKLGSEISKKESMFGTPYSIIYDSNGNTKVIIGSQPYEDVKKIIDSLILK